MVVQVCASSKVAVAIDDLRDRLAHSRRIREENQQMHQIVAWATSKDVALYSKSAKLRLPLRSIVEEYKVSKIWTQWMLNDSVNIRIHKVKLLLRTKRNFKAHVEIDKSVSELTFEEMRGPIQTGRHAVRWNHFPKWSEPCSMVRAGIIIQERRREMERKRVTMYKAMQQA